MSLSTARIEGTHPSGRAPSFRVMMTLFLIIAPALAHAQTITQIIDRDGAGDPNSFGTPRGGIAVDGPGNVYVVADFKGNAFKIDPNGLITEIIRGDGNVAVDLLLPRWVAADAAGNVYVTGLGSSNAFWITPDGMITEIIDPNGDNEGNTLKSASGVAVDESGNVYVAGATSENVFRIDPNGTIKEIIDGLGEGAPGRRLANTAGIAVDSEGDVFVTGKDSDNVFMVPANGPISLIIDPNSLDLDMDPNTSEFNEPFSVAVDGLGNVYVSALRSNNAFKITSNGVITEIINASGDDTHGLNRASDIAVDDSGNVYVTGANSDNAFQIDPNGRITQIIDSSGDGAGHALDNPVGVTTDQFGNVYVVGQLSNNVFQIELRSCGNGIVESGEECDDGNTADGDGCSSSCLSVPEIDVAPLALDFGVVNAFTSMDMIVTVQNIGEADLTLFGVSLTGDSSFSISPANLPPILTPMSTLDIVVTFAPTSLALNAANLEITSDDGDEPTVSIELLGNGIAGDPGEQLTVLEMAVADAIAAGTLEGLGRGRSAPRRLRAFTNMVRAARHLIESGFSRAGCGQLRSALRRVDGKRRPPDFVTGEATDQIAAQIELLRATLGCN